MKEKPQSKGDSKPQDSKINIHSMEIPPKPKPSSSTSTPNTSKPNKK